MHVFIAADEVVTQKVTSLPSSVCDRRSCPVAMTVVLVGSDSGRGPSILPCLLSFT